MRLPFVFASVDVEAAHGQDPFEQMILGRLDDGRYWGVFEIARLLEEQGFTGTFFVDVYEDVLWGEARMKALCQDLVARGHDVQLHTHPGWRYDPRDSQALNDFKKNNCRFPPEKDLMAKLSLAEQTELIREGKALLESWTGKSVIAHRSGGYSINADTITALEAAGITIDSSMNIGHSNSKLHWSDVVPVQRGATIELPITCYRLAASKAAPGVFNKLLKTDVDVTPLWIFKAMTRDYEAAGIPILHLFMHSYSLLDMAVDFGHFRPHEARHRTMRKYLAYLRKEGWTVGGVEALTAHPDWQSTVLQGIETIPVYRDVGLISKLAAKRMARQAVAFGRRFKRTNSSKGTQSAFQDDS